MASPQPGNHLSYSFQQKSSREFSSNGIIKWKVEYMSSGYGSEELYLLLVSGTSSATIFYHVHVVYYEDHTKHDLYSYSKKSVSLNESVCLNVPYKESKGGGWRFSKTTTTYLELCILESTPFVTIPSKSLLSSDLSSTLSSEENGLNDVTLYFGEEEKPLLASKFMLSARSPVFRTMLQSDFKEAKSCNVKIPDISPDVGQEMITYMYTDKAPRNLSTSTTELWQAADKYDLPGLKALCENELAKQLNVENAARILLFAGEYSGGELKDSVLKFITQSKETCSRAQMNGKKLKNSPSLHLLLVTSFLMSLQSLLQKKHVHILTDFPVWNKCATFRHVCYLHNFS